MTEAQQILQAISSLATQVTTLTEKVDSIDKRLQGIEMVQKDITLAVAEGFKKTHDLLVDQKQLENATEQIEEEAEFGRERLSILEEKVLLTQQAQTLQQQTQWVMNEEISHIKKSLARLKAE